MYGAAEARAARRGAPLRPLTPTRSRRSAPRRARGARRRRLLAGLHAQRHRLRRLSPASARRRAEQPRRLGVHHRGGPDPERRHALAPAGPRPDVAEATVALLEAPREPVHGQAFNVGADAENYQVRDLAEIVREACRVRGGVRRGRLPTRGATASTSASSARCPTRAAATAREGAQELHDAYQAAGLTFEEFDGPRFTRLKRLRSCSARASSARTFAGDDLRETRLPARSSSTPSRSRTSAGGSPASTTRRIAERGLAARFVQAAPPSTRNRAPCAACITRRPDAEAKLVRCIRGAVRRDRRPAAGLADLQRWTAVELTAADGRMLYVPEGLAHGYLTLADASETST